MHSCIPTHIHVNVQPYVQTCIHTYTNIHAHTPTNSHTYIHIHVHMHIYIVRTYTHTTEQRSVRCHVNAGRPCRRCGLVFCQNHQGHDCDGTEDGAEAPPGKGAVDADALRDNFRVFEADYGTRGEGTQGGDSAETYIHKCMHACIHAYLHTYM